MVWMYIFLADRLKRKADESRRRMDEINRERQAIQSTHGPKLKTLAKRWAETMAKNQQIEVREEEFLIFFPVRTNLRRLRAPKLNRKSND